MHYKIIKCWKLISNIKTVSKTWTGLFVDTKLRGLNKHVRISVSSNFQYFFLSCLYRGQPSEKAIVLQLKQNLFSIGMKGLQNLTASSYNWSALILNLVGYETKISGSGRMFF